MPGSARNAGLLLFSFFCQATGRDATRRDASVRRFSLRSSPFPSITSFSLICPEEQIEAIAPIARDSRR